MKLSPVLLFLPLLLACAGNEDGDVTGADLEGTAPVDIVLTLGCTSVETTRSTPMPRELISTDNWQHATNVRLYAFRAENPDSTYRYCLCQDKEGRTTPYIYVPEFAAKGHNTWKNTQDEWYEKVVRTRVEKGYYYKFLAIGRDDISEDDESKSAWELNIAPGISLDEAQAKLPQGMLTGTELFSGSNEEPFCIDDTVRAIKRRVVMKRAVAGLLMYVENVPFKMRGIQVGAVGIAKQEYYQDATLLNSRRFGGNLIPTTTPLIKVDMPTVPLIGNDGEYIQTNPNNASHPNSFLKGCFLTPQPIINFTTGIGRTPLVFVYYDLNGNEIERRNIYIKNNEAPDGSTSTPATDNAYPLLANHIYSLGQKRNGKDEPKDLTPDPDEPDGNLILEWGQWQGEVNIDL